MRGMREVEVTPTAAGRFEAVIGGDRFAQFSQLADATRARFLGRSIWNINAAETDGVDIPNAAAEKARAGGIGQLGELGEAVAAAVRTRCAACAKSRSPPLLPAGSKPSSAAQVSR